MKTSTLVLRVLSILFMALAVVSFFIPLNRLVKDSFFDGQVSVERARHGLSSRDTVTFIFNQPGTYQIAFFPRQDGSLNSVPKNFTIEVHEADVPLIKVVKKYTINDCTIMIVKNGVSIDQQDFYLPERE